MEFNDVLRQRMSIRFFKPDRLISDEDLTAIVQEAQQAPSWVNSQPWKVYIATGKTLEQIKTSHFDKVNRGVLSGSDFPALHRTDMGSWGQKNANDWTVDFKEQMGSHFSDFAKSQQKLFDAPAIAYLTLPKNPGEWSIYDLGAFGQTLMLAAANRHIDSMPAWEIVRFPETLHKILEIPDDQIIGMGIALGYRDEKQPINQYRSQRSAVGDVLTIKH